MQAIILAGGEGTRLRSVVRDRPKPMAEIAGKPFLEYLLLQLKQADIEDIILSIGYKGNVIQSYFKTGAERGVKIAYSIEQQPLGTGGAVREAIACSSDDVFIVMNGDSFFDLDIHRLLQFHHENNGLGTIALTNIHNSERYGNVTVNHKGEIIRFEEKSAAVDSVINCGVYILQRTILSFLSAEEVSLEKEIFPQLIGKGLFGMIQAGYFIDIGIPSDYMFLQTNSGPLFKALGLPNGNV